MPSYKYELEEAPGHTTSNLIHEFEGPISPQLARKQAEMKWGPGGRLFQEVDPSFSRTKDEWEGSGVVGGCVGSPAETTESGFEIVKNLGSRVVERDHAKR
jgi:hypothetical protein